MPVLETLALISTIAAGGSQIAGGVSKFIEGKKAEEEAEKAQKYDERMFERLYADEQRKYAESTAMTKASQKFNRDLAKRNEIRTDQDRLYTRLQTAANKYAEILNNSRSMQRSNAAALTNR